jgi:hypothetical protein
MDAPLTLEAVCVPSEDVVARLIGDEIVLVPLASGIGDAEDDLYTLSETGRAIWERLDGVRPLAQIAADLADEYESAAGPIADDVLGFSAELLRRRILVVAAV